MQRTLPLPRSQPAALRGSEPPGRDRGRPAAAGRPGHAPGAPLARFWAPFWLWSDAPVPELPQRSAGSRSRRSLVLAGHAVVTGIDRVRRRLWVSHAAAAICRGLWLAHRLRRRADAARRRSAGRTFDPRPAARSRRGDALRRTGSGGLEQTVSRAHGTDARSHLRAARAAEDGARRSRPRRPRRRASARPVVYLQMADAANAVAALRNDRRLRPAIPVREVVLVVLFALLLTTLAFVRGLGGGLPELAAGQRAGLHPGHRTARRTRALRRRAGSGGDGPDDPGGAGALRPLGAGAARSASPGRGDGRPRADPSRRRADRPRRLRRRRRAAPRRRRPGRRPLPGRARGAGRRSRPGREHRCSRKPMVSRKRPATPRPGCARATSPPQTGDARPRGRGGAGRGGGRAAGRAGLPDAQRAAGTSPARRQRRAVGIVLAGRARQRVVERERRRGARQRGRCGGGDRVSGAVGPERQRVGAERRGDGRDGGSRRRRERAGGRPRRRTAAGRGRRAACPATRRRAAKKPAGCRAKATPPRASKAPEPARARPANRPEEGAGASAADLEVGMGEDAADPNVTTDGAAEADPSALEGASDAGGPPLRLGRAGRADLVRRRVGAARLRRRDDGGLRVRRAGRSRRSGPRFQPGSSRAPGNGRALFLQRRRRMSAPAGWLAHRAARAATAVPRPRRAAGRRARPGRRANCCSTNATLARLRRLSLVAGRARTEGLAGEHRSRRRGTSPEFADFKRYSQGDDFRRIDWNTYARLDGLFVRLSEVTTELSVHFLLDSSASMDWRGTDGPADEVRRRPTPDRRAGLHRALGLRSGLDRALRAKRSAGPSARCRAGPRSSRSCATCDGCTDGRHRADAGHRRLRPRAARAPVSSSSSPICSPASRRSCKRPCTICGRAAGRPRCCTSSTTRKSPRTRPPPGCTRDDDGIGAILDRAGRPRIGRDPAPGAGRRSGGTVCRRSDGPGSTRLEAACAAEQTAYARVSTAWGIDDLTVALLHERGVVA